MSDALFTERLMATAYQNAKNWALAVHNYNIIISREPKNAGALYERAWCYSQQNLWEAGFNDATEALRFQPDHPQATMGHNIIGGYHRVSGQLELAVKSYTSAIARSQAAGHRLERGKCLALLKQFDRAIDDLSVVINQGYQIPDAAHVRAQCYFWLSKWAEALADYNVSLQHDPNDATSFGQRGECHVQLGDVHLAIADLTEAIRLNPSLSGAFALRATCNAKAGRAPEALQDANVAIRLNPSLSGAYQDRAQLYFDAERWAEALADLDVLSTLRALSGKEYLLASACCWMLGAREGGNLRHTQNGLAHAQAALAMNLVMPDIAWALFLRAGYLLYEEERTEECIADLDKAIRLRMEDGSNPLALAECYQRRALAHIQAADYAKAIADLTEAMRSQTQGRHYRLRGFCHKRLGHWPQAMNDFAEALRLDPSDVFTYTSRGECYILQDMLSEALDDLDQAIELDSQLDLAYLFRARALMEMAAWPGALEDLNMVLELARDAPPAGLCTLYEWRAECQEALGNDDEAIADRAAADSHRTDDDKPDDFEAPWLWN